MKRLEDMYENVLGHITTIEATYHIAKMAIELGVPGDFVECGVYAGAQSAAMARAIQDTFSLPNTTAIGRRVHLFDTFAGFPALTVHDGDLLRAGTKAGDSACPLEDVKAGMNRWRIQDELLVYHKGLFDITVPWAAGAIAAPEAGLLQISKIAVLRLDGDLYESTRVCMRYLYPLVSKGGWVIVDDWNLDGCRKAIEETISPNAGEPGYPAPIYWRKEHQ